LQSWRKEKPLESNQSLLEENVNGFKGKEFPSDLQLVPQKCANSASRHSLVPAAEGCRQRGSGEKIEERGLE